jgi:putative phage-type endonuclease
METDNSNEIINGIYSDLSKNNNFEETSFFDLKECEELIESAGNLIHDYVSANPMLFTDPKFHENAFNYVEQILKEQLYLIMKIKKNTSFGEFSSSIFEDDIDDTSENEDIKLNVYCEFIELIEYAFSIFYRFVAPQRSSGDTYIRVKPNITRQREKINYLKSVPQPEQRTDEWYIFRQQFLTASSIWKAFGTQASQNQLIYDKCKPLNIDKYKTVSTETAMHWGNKYEPISIQIYELLYETQVSDFGCIPHKTIPYIAASPDGINTLETSTRYGRMLEVKNIVNREINGIPKKEYWIQMQMQMEVCNLNECDFLETRFKEYEDYQDFINDTCLTISPEEEENNNNNKKNFMRTQQGEFKGMIICFNKDGQPFYEYSPIHISLQKELNEWEDAIMKKYEKLSWIRNIYWRLDQLSCVLVLRNKLWFNYCLPILNNIWDIITYEKINGYEHRAPIKRKKADNVNVRKIDDECGGVLGNTKCLINTSKLDFNINYSE